MPTSRVVLCYRSTTSCKLAHDVNRSGFLEPAANPMEHKLMPSFDLCARPLLRPGLTPSDGACTTPSSTCVALAVSPQHRDYYRRFKCANVIRSRRRWYVCHDAAVSSHPGIASHIIFSTLFDLSLIDPDRRPSLVA